MSTSPPPSVWYGSALAAQEDQWIHHFSTEEIAELEVGYAALAATSVENFQQLTVDDFPLPALAPVLRDQAAQIEHGRGFAFFRGLPVERWGVQMSRVIYWGLSLHIGRPIRQNARGDRLVQVMDVGAAPDEPTARGPYGRGDLHFHSDFADAVGLMCLRTARHGGVSRIASSRTILDHMRREHPEFIPVFERGFYFYRKGEQALGEPPVTRERVPMLEWKQGEPVFLFWPAFAKQGHQFSGHPLSPLEAQALAWVNEQAHSEHFCLDTHFQPGDIQYLNNYKVLHSRTDFDDWPEPDRRRYLERIWLCTDAERHLPPGFADLHDHNSLLNGFPELPAHVVEERAREAKGIAA